MRAPFTFAWLLFLCACQPLMAEVQITHEGLPQATIILAGGGAARSLSTKALVGHLKQMSGATLAVMHEKELNGASVENGRIIPPVGDKMAPNFIVLGEGELTKQLGISSEGLGLGGILLKSGGNFIVIAGTNDSVAAKSPDVNTTAVFTFLESLGCRFLWPGESGKVIPKTPTISVSNLDVRFTPPIGQRKIRFAGLDVRGAEEGLASLGFTNDDYKKARDAASVTESDGSWAQWHGLGGNIGIVGGAAGYGLQGGWEQHGAAHPEWFALQADGTRDQSKAKERWRLCISNPGLIDHVASDIIARLNGKAQQGAVSLCPNDGGYSSFCLCDACQKLDAPDAPKVKMLVFKKVGEPVRDEVEHVSLTDRFVHYWNAVVERVTKVVPDQTFLVEAYSYYSDPPMRETLHPNLVLRYVPNNTDGWKGWQAAGAKRVYWRPNNLHGGHYDAALSPRARENSATLRHLADSGMLATDMDSLYHHWSTQGVHYYMMAKLSWNPKQDFDELLDDYCKAGFNAGAGHVRQYFLHAEKNIVIPAGKRAFPQISADTIDTLRAHLVAAAKATENDATARRRVAFLRAGLEFTALSVEGHRLADAVKDGTKPDPKVVNDVMDRRWQLMRGLLHNHPLAVNVGVVAATDAVWTRPLPWKGPTEGAKTGRLPLSPGDDWLNDDQSATRR